MGISEEVSTGLSIDSLFINAVIEGDIKTLVELIRFGVDVNMIDFVGWTPLRYAANNGRREVVEFLIDNGSDIEAKSDNGWTALHHAASNGHLGVVDLLLCRCNNVNVRNSDNRTALYYSIINEHFEVAELLTKNNATVQLYQK